MKLNKIKLNQATILWPHKQPAAKQEKCRTDDDQSVPNGTYTNGISPIFKNRYHHKVINIIAGISDLAQIRFLK